MPTWSRLQDPKNLVPGKKLEELREKISTTMTRMVRMPQNGGNPFLFSLSAPKPHLLADELPGHRKGPDGKPTFTTAATDGRRYYWSPEFLDAVDYDELAFVMYHESLHVAFFHSERLIHASARQRNIAMDYVVNTILVNDREKSMGPNSCNNLWGRRLGTPLPLKEFLDHIDGTIEVDFSKMRCYMDKAVTGRSPESIYAEIMKHWDKSPRKCPKCAALSMDPKTGKPKKPPCKNHPLCEHDGHCCPTCGALPGVGSPGPYGDGIPGGNDAHMPSEATKSQVQTDLMRAAQRAKSSLRGSVPSEVEDALGLLSKPVLKFTDLMMSDCMKKSREEGSKNDYKHMRRRWIVASPRQYLPTRMSFEMDWLAMIDTSGSMGDDDIAFGISQLQALAAKGTKGIIVCCDASVKWKDAQPVKSIKDLKRTKIVGRGGTVFDDFFRDFKKHLGVAFATITVITDGDCGTVPANLRPPIPVNWVLTRKQPDSWKQPFGRVLQLRNERA